MLFYEMVSNEGLINGDSIWINHFSKIQAFKCAYAFHFQNWTPLHMKLIFRISFFKPILIWKAQGVPQ